MARSQVCQVCSPQGGAIFDRHGVNSVCRNCGNIKARRQPTAPVAAGKAERSAQLNATLAQFLPDLAA